MFGVVSLVAFKMQDEEEIRKRRTEYHAIRPNSTSDDFLLQFQQGNINETKKALQVILKDHGLENTSFHIVRTYGRYFPDHQSVPRAFKLLLEQFPNFPLLNYDLAVYYSYFQKDEDATYEELEKAMAKGFEDYDKMILDPWLFQLKRNFSRWDTFLLKHFPEQYNSTNK